MINGPGFPVGQLIRYQITGRVELAYFCDCPDCQSRHSRWFDIDETVIDVDENRAINQVLNRQGYDFTDIEWHDGPDVQIAPFGEDERMALANAPRLF